MALKAVSVTQINQYIKRILASDPILANASVIGEVSNLTRHSSGHWYFSLKDETSTIRCFLPKDRVLSLRYDIEEGMKITCYGYIGVYERGGSYSLNIRDILVEGEGDLKKAYDLLFNKLEKEGLFDEGHKRPIPSFPKKIAVISSPTGAAVHDIITTIKRRNPLIDVLLYPCLVQGEEAGKSIAEAIKTVNKNPKGCELIIAGRGGGSAEDLWAFNEEIVARAVYDSELPVISAVGHEVDFVISDYAADLRAATPTAAAELAACDIEYYRDIIRSSAPERLFSSLERRIENEELKIKHLMQICESSALSRLTDAKHKLALLMADIEGFNPKMQLEKGYSIVKNNNRWISSVSETDIDDKINVILKDGELECLVLKKL